MMGSAICERSVNLISLCKLLIPAHDGPRVWMGPFAVMSGYFLWGSVVCLVHGLGCMLVYLNAFRPSFAYYGPCFLLWKLSTPFLNIHWMLDKMGQTGSPLQLVNGLVLISTFAGARLVYGSIMVHMRPRPFAKQSSPSH
ncbi:hypothetical protein EDB87DRAFT_696295 [Lactarius vividus]|nr:hypothetical protein EDB87DRAFT_696295 [Lactarius vividus]